MEDIFEWLIPVLFFSVPLVSLLIYLVSVTGWIFSPKESHRREKFNKLCKASSRIIIGWLTVFGVIMIFVLVFILIFGIPAQQ
ncbi:MAG: hypothetical protein IJX15_00985 [Ruminiclostridium sp.]|nr:hypothetical protein [Ruminiclostridium sp.]